MNDVVSKVAGSSITMSLVSAMFFSLFIAMIFEFIRSHNIKEAFAGLQTFFVWAGRFAWEVSDGSDGSFSAVVGTPPLMR